MSPWTVPCTKATCDRTLIYFHPYVGYVSLSVSPSLELNLLLMICPKNLI